jgi:dTDP-4-amino-4,6-dideoxygalactose transaminase
MSIPMADLKAQYLSIKDEVDAAMRRVIENSQFILGPEVDSFEKEMATYCGTAYATGVASGTEALQLALLACGIRPGDEVITTPFTFIATAEAITQCGANPVFVDIDPLTYNIDPKLIEAKITPKTRCMLPVHLYGEPADMDPIMAIAKRHNLKVIEDCAQALGAQYKKQSRVGSIGDAGCLSFFPSKTLGAYGDGGMVVTNDQQVAEKLKMLRNHGARQKYYHLVPGFNSRLDGLQAAILGVKLKYLDKWIEQRRRVADLYAKHLGKIPHLALPHQARGNYHCFNYYTVRLLDGVINRESLQKSLNSKGIGSMVYYPVSLHLQEVYTALGGKQGDFPHSEKAQGEVLSLPIYPEMTEAQVEQVTQAIGEYKK